METNKRASVTMIRMTIERMSIQNFKGTRELTINFGELTRVSGMNSTGKSTIPDAFCWVLWNKDSHGNAPGSYEFREKPLDTDGNEIHNLDTTVELDCRLNGQPFKLRRTQRENWVKKRGATEAVFQGNVSTYWINDVETKLTDFKARIAQITSEEVFRLIGSLSAFNAMDWKKRLEQLIALSDTDVDSHLMQRDEYRPLADECAQRGVDVEDLRKILADQRKRTNDELKMIPIRIDEARKALPTFKAHEVEDAEYIVKDILNDIGKIDGYIAEAKAASGSTGYRERILALETEAVSLQRTVSDAHRAKIRALEQGRDLATDAFRRASEDLTDMRRRVERDRADLEKATTARDDLRKQYSTEYERRFEPPKGDNICPTCKQPLPSEMVQAALDAAQQTFDAARKSSLADIKQRGIDKAAEVTRLTDRVSQSDADITTLERKVEAASKERDDAYDKIKAIPTEPDYGTEPRIAELLKQIDALKKEQTASPDEKVRQYETRKAELRAIVECNQTIIARRDAGKETEKRIETLEKQQKETAARIAELEQLVALVERFLQDRCYALEDSINAKFPNVRWKLFKDQINGGINDTCDCYIPCDSGLVSYGAANTAAQVNSDIEIVNVLSQHYGLSLPLFADNSERINVLSHTDSQLISLAVSTDSELKIEQLKEAS
ncbi:MAG: AAA family ATPase [Clostridia bacterium]